MRVLLLLALALPALCLPVSAGETAWQEVAPGVSIRLVSAGAPSGNGTALFGLEIDMPADTKTYWRIPGETGLPTELDFTGSTGIGRHELHWPHPLREVSDGYLDHVYFGPTVLPIELEVTDPQGVVNLQATLGICSDICVPAQARLSLPVLDPAPDRANALRIRQALASVPIPWPENPEPAGPVRLTGDGAAILVEIDSEQIDPQSLFVAGGPEAPLFGAPQKSPQPNLVLLPIMGKTDNSTLEGMEVDLTFMTPRGAFEVSRTIEAGADAVVDVPGQ